MNLSKRLILMTCIFALTLVFGIPLLAQDDTLPETVWGTTTAYVNMRAQPSLNTIVLDVVPYETDVRIYAIDSTRSWAAIFYNGRTGWVSLNFIDDIEDLNLGSLPVQDVLLGETAVEEEESAPSGVSVYMEADQYLQSSQTTDSPRLATAPTGATVIATAISPDYDWLVVYYEGVTGWIQREDIRVTDGQLLDLPDSEAIFTVQSGTSTEVVNNDTIDALAWVQVNNIGLNLRTSPSTGGGIQDVVPAGSEVPVAAISSDFDWILVAYDGTIGWIARQYVTVIEGQLIELPVSDTVFR